MFNFKILDYSERNICKLPKLPRYLEVLLCNNCLITELPESLPLGLEFLNCQVNQLTKLPKLPKSLKKLYCYDNQIKKIDILPENLEELVCCDNKLTELPSPLPLNLELLYCGGNKLTELPDLPATLIELDCQYNNLTKIPNLPFYLTELDCGGNQLTKLPRLPINLKILECFDNNLTKLPKLPPNLELLYAFGNDNLTELPFLPESLRYIDFAVKGNIPNFGEISFYDDWRTYRRYHNALITFQRIIRNRVLPKKIISLKEKCRRCIMIYSVEIKGLVPDEVKSFLDEYHIFGNKKEKDQIFVPIKINLD